MGDVGVCLQRNLEPGELLLVSNPLAVERGNFGFEIPHKTIPKKITVELVDKIRRSNLQVARLGFLASDDIPSMELFRPGSGWIPPARVKEETNVDFIRDIARRKMFHYVWGEGTRLRIMGSSSIRKAFLYSKLSTFVCDTIFFRASGDIMEGEELTVSYVSNWYEYFTERRETLEIWMFKCECDRCLFEETLPPQLANIYDASEANKELTVSLTQRMSNTRKLKNAVDKIEAEQANAADEIDTVIQSLGSNTPPKQQGWIRASFKTVYMARLRVNDSIAFMRLIVDSMRSVYVTSRDLGIAAWLLDRVHEQCSRDSQTYLDTVDQVLRIYRVYFGKLPDAALHKLI